MTNVRKPTVQELELAQQLAIRDEIINEYRSATKNL